MSSLVELFETVTDHYSVFITTEVISTNHEPCNSLVTYRGPIMNLVTAS